MYSNKIVRSIASAAVLLLISAPSFADLTKCATLINKENAKMQAKMLKHFQKCIDFYHKDLAKPPTPPLSKAAPKCEKELGKGINAGGDLDKEVTKKLIAKFDGKTCIESDLLALGHLSHTLYGDNWARIQSVSAFHSAYEQALAGSRDFIQSLYDMGKTGSCPSCVKVQLPLCNDAGGPLVSGSGFNVLVGGLPLAGSLNGLSVLKFCDNTASGAVSGGILPGIPASTFYVLGGPGKTLVPSVVGTLATACTRTLAAEGIVQCGAGAQHVNYTTCQDHQPSAGNGDGATASGGCTGQTSCARAKPNSEQSQVDPNEASDELIGGACISLQSSTGSAGDGFVNLTSQIGIHAFSLNDNCQDPSTLTDPGTPSTTALTTGTASAKVLNADPDAAAAAEVDSAEVSGSPFNCATLKAGQTTGTKLAGAFPAINTLQLSPGQYLDSVTTFTLAQ
jgi:hypothetical protein